MFLGPIAAAPALQQTRNAAQAQQPAGISPATSQSAPAQQSPAPTPPAQTSSAAPNSSLNIVVLDPAHGGTDFGARGTGGIHESDIVLEFAGQVRTALEYQGFQVIQTRQAHQNPSFDDRSAIANAQRGA